MKYILKSCSAASLIGAFAFATFAQPRATNKEILLQNESLTIHYHRQAGTMDILWRDGQKLLGVASGATLEDGTQLNTGSYTKHDLENTAPENRTNGVHEYTIRSSSPGKPDILQHIWLQDGKPWISIEAELGPDASKIGTRHFDAVVLKNPDAIQFHAGAALRVLHVPFDNDMWFRYESKPVPEIKDGQTFSSDEVTAVYDNTSRNALVLGSIAHDTWKTAIDVQAAGGHISSLDIYGGISSPTGVRTDTHDTIPHGLVHGEHVTSPCIFIGAFSDWREGLEAYGKANAAVHPPLVWPAGAPVGWNSWGAYAEKINDQRYLNVAAFLRDSLVPQGFSRNKIVYVNLDAFWSRLDAVQLADAAEIIHGMQGADGVRFEPGIYWTPFAYWSDDLDAYVEGTNMKYRYRDILLKAPDGSFLPKVDGGRAIDPSHPANKMRIDYTLKQFQKLGFTYLKLDFLAHGSLEGAHYDPAIQTGVQAYNEGMQQVVDAAAGKMFLSLSIAPLFPSGYGHARRLSCDTKGHVDGGDQSTEYMLNSLTYGWWTAGNQYIADPDHIVLGVKGDLGARSIVEGKTRLMSAIVSGGMILDSSPIADDPQAQEFAKAVYNNRNLFEVASEGKVFYPIEGDSGNKATPAFIRPSAHGFYLAVFNYSYAQPQAITIPLDRIDAALAKQSSVTATDVASGSALDSPHGSITIQLQPAESKLIELH